MSTFSALTQLGLSTVVSFFSNRNFWFHFRFLAASAAMHVILANLHFYTYSYWILCLILESKRLEVSSPAVRSHGRSLILPLDVSG